MYRILDWFGLYIVLVLTSATIYWWITGIPFMQAIMAGMLVNVFKVAISKFWHWLFSPKKVCKKCSTSLITPSSNMRIQSV